MTYTTDKESYVKCKHFNSDTHHFSNGNDTAIAYEGETFRDNCEGFFVSFVSGDLYSGTGKSHKPLLPSHKLVSRCSYLRIMLWVLSLNLSESLEKEVHLSEGQEPWDVRLSHLHHCSALMHHLILYMRQGLRYYRQNMIDALVSTTMAVAGAQ